MPKARKIHNLIGHIPRWIADKSIDFIRDVHRIDHTHYTTYEYSQVALPIQKNFAFMQSVQIRMLGFTQRLDLAWFYYSQVAPQQTSREFYPSTFFSASMSCLSLVIERRVCCTSLQRMIVYYVTDFSVLYHAERSSMGMDHHHCFVRDLHAPVCALGLSKNQSSTGKEKMDGPACQS
jgi:hypothetical protein